MTWRDDRGSVTGMMCVLAVVLLALGALVFDGARVFAARRDTHNVALQAARAGAQQLDPAQARSGVFVLDPYAADAAARQFVVDAGGADQVSVEVSGDRVTVRLEVVAETPLWAVLGIDDKTIDASASAIAARGVVEEGS